MLVHASSEEVPCISESSDVDVTQTSLAKTGKQDAAHQNFVVEMTGGGWDDGMVDSGSEDEEAGGLDPDAEDAIGAMGLRRHDEGMEEAIEDASEACSEELTCSFCGATPDEDCIVAYCVVGPSIHCS
jgi:hypothetical protein